MKIFILEPSFLNVSEDITKKLIELNNDLSVCKKYSSNIFYKDNYNNFYDYMSIDDINLSFKNNSLLYITYKKNEITSTSIDSYYNGDIIPIKYNEFNDIIGKYLNDVLIVWVDSTKHKNINKRELKKDINGVNFLYETINNLKLKYLYFMDDTIDNITDTVNKYLQSSPEEKILLEKIHS